MPRGKYPRKGKGRGPYRTQYRPSATMPVSEMLENLERLKAVDTRIASVWDENYWKNKTRRQLQRMAFSKEAHPFYGRIPHSIDDFSYVPTSRQYPNQVDPETGEPLSTSEPFTWGQKGKALDLSEDTTPEGQSFQRQLEKRMRQYVKDGKITWEQFDDFFSNKIVGKQFSSDVRSAQETKDFDRFRKAQKRVFQILQAETFEAEKVNRQMMNEAYQPLTKEQLEQLGTYWKIQTAVENTDPTLGKDDNDFAEDVQTEETRERSRERKYYIG